MMFQTSKSPCKSSYYVYKVSIIDLLIEAIIHQIHKHMYMYTYSVDFAVNQPVHSTDHVVELLLSKQDIQTADKDMRCV